MVGRSRLLLSSRGGLLPSLCESEGEAARGAPDLASGGPAEAGAAGRSRPFALQGVA